MRRVLQQQLVLIDSQLNSASKKLDLRVTLQLCGSAKAPVDLKQITYLGLSVRIITLSASLFSRPLVESASFCWGRCLFGIEILDLTGGLDFVCCGFGSPVVVSRIKTRSWSELFLPFYLGKISKLMSIDSSIEATIELNSCVYTVFAKDSSLMVIIPVKP